MEDPCRTLQQPITRSKYRNQANGWDSDVFARELFHSIVLGSLYLTKTCGTLNTCAILYLVTPHIT